MIAKNELRLKLKNKANGRAYIYLFILFYFIYLFIYLFGQTLLNQWLPPTWRKRPQHTINTSYIQEVFIHNTQEDGNKNHIFKMVLRACHARFK